MSRTGLGLPHRDDLRAPGAVLRASYRLKSSPTDESVKPQVRVYRRVGRGRSRGEERGDGDGPRRAALPGPGRGLNQSLPGATAAAEGAPARGGRPPAA